MNITIIAIELLVMFLAFLLLAFGLLLISPLTFISDYPPEIQEEYYRSQILKESDFRGRFLL